MSANNSITGKNTRATRLTKRLIIYAQLMRLHKPIGILLLLWPTLWAMWIAAEGNIQPNILLIFILGVILMRSAGCVINDLADRKFDRQVARTKHRPLATNALRAREALVLFIILSLTAFVLVLQLNRLTIQLSVVALILAATYPLAKRFTYFPQAYLGVAFAWSVPMAYTAQSNAVNTMTLLLFFAAVTWTIAYDTMYAMVDREDDLKIGVKSTAIRFGQADRSVTAMLQVIFLSTLTLIGFTMHLGWSYFAGITVAGALCGYQQWLIRHRQPERCFKAFLNNNYVGMVIFVGLFAHYHGF